MSSLCEQSRSSVGAVSLAIAFVSVSIFVLPGTSEAIPAFARQFNASCSTCHTPVPPRLNNLGITFKRLGYRMPDADDEGKLILKDKPSRSVFEDFSLVADFRGESARDEEGRFKLDELMALGGGAINKHLAYQGELTYSGGAVALETLEGHLIAGRPEVNVTARFGVLVPEIWTKCNTQRLTVFTPLLNSTSVPIGGFGGFSLHDAQRGVEVGLNLNHLGDAGAIRSTFLSVGVYDGLLQNQGGLSFDQRNFRNVVVQAVHLFGDSHSIAALWYHGNAKYGPETFQDTTDRLALMGNYRLATGTDMLAGVNVGRDTTTEPAIGRVSSRGWFAEVNQAIGTKTAALVRFDRVNPDRVTAATRVDGPTIGLTRHLLDNLLLNAEYRGLKTGSDVRGRDLVARIIVAY
jgi:hypothetical protein